jgi:hypothetical protein
MVKLVAIPARAKAAFRLKVQLIGAPRSPA